ncbi:MAG: hypothetical protein LUD46_06340 [Parabacteroides sp.]|nr:hypothetical protein [Parabacteroides sp.]
MENWAESGEERTGQDRKGKHGEAEVQRKNAGYDALAPNHAEQRELKPLSFFGARFSDICCLRSGIGYVRMGFVV